MSAMDIHSRDMNLYPVLINMGLFVVIAAWLASFAGFMLA